MINNSNILKNKISGTYINMRTNKDNKVSILFKDKNNESFVLHNVENNDLLVHLIKDKKYNLEYLDVDGKNYLLSLNNEQKIDNIKDYVLSKIMAAYHLEDSRMILSTFLFSGILFSSSLFESTSLLIVGMVGVMASVLFFSNKKEKKSKLLTNRILAN